jgi:hypothetical protein
VTVPATTWTFTTAPQIKNGLSRTITLENVCRDGSGNISAGGTVYEANVKTDNLNSKPGHLVPPETIQ